MDLKNFGEKLAAARKDKNLSQEQLACRLAITPQAVSKWERGISYPDIVLLTGLCDVLDCSSDYLLSRETNKTRLTEDGNEKTAERLLRMALAEPLVIEFGEGLITLITEEYNEEFPSIRGLREKLALSTGILLPVVHIKDNLKLESYCYRILSFDVVLFTQSLPDLNNFCFQTICERLEATVKENFAILANRQMIQNMVDALAEQSPAAVKGVIPEKISLSQLQAVLTAMVRKGKTIRPLLKILEVMEDAEGSQERLTADALAERIIQRLKL